MDMKEFEKYKNMAIDEIDESELVDINEVDVRMDLPQAQAAQ